ncbi:MAG: hypothetical protein ACRDYB_16355 [Acidimicrobiales bacterium]
MPWNWNPEDGLYLLPYTPARNVMASLRNLVISKLRLDGATNIAQALRHHSPNPQRPVTLLLAC